MGSPISIGKTPGISPDPESGQSILISKIFTLDHADNLQLGKRSTVLISAVERRTRPEQLQLAESLSEKSQKQLLLATQTAETGHRGAGERFWCGRRDLNSRTIDVMVSRVVGLEAQWTLPCYVLDQARLRPHRPPRLPLGSSILRFGTSHV
jgi:hypothetical protein